MMYVLLVLMTIMGSFGAYFLKKSTMEIDHIAKVLFSKFFYIGGILYFTSALINILILKVLDYSVVLPMTSLTYVWSVIIGYKLLNENVSKKVLYGMVLIIIGAILISKG